MENWALITGASSGFGVDYAHILAQKGHSIVLTARRMERLESLKTEIEQKYSVKVHCIAIDLSTEDGPIDLYNKTTALNIQIKILINNAGFGSFGKFDEQEMKESTDMIQLNITALTQLCHLYTKDMKSLGEGYILLVASLVGYMPTPLYSVYAATKAYVISFGEALAAEYSPLNIQVSTLSPSMTKTEFMDVSGQSLSTFERMMMMNSYPVAKRAINSLFAKRTSSLPNISSYIIKILLNFIPSKIIATITYRVMRSKC